MGVRIIFYERKKSQYFTGGNRSQTGHASNRRLHLFRSVATKQFVIDVNGTSVREHFRPDESCCGQEMDEYPRVCRHTVGSKLNYFFLS